MDCRTTPYTKRGPRTDGIHAIRLRDVQLRSTSLKRPSTIFDPGQDVRGKGVAGGVIAAAGVILIVLGIYRVLTSDFIQENVPTIVSDGFAYVLYGAVVFIAGVVIVNFRNWIALALHLAAVVPYYYPIPRVLEVGPGAGPAGLA